MGTVIVEGEDLFALPEEHGIEAGKFEHLRLAVDEGIEIDGLMPRLAGEPYRLAGSGSV